MDTSAFDDAYRRATAKTVNKRTGSCSDTYSDDEIPPALVSQVPTEHGSRKRPVQKRKQKGGEQGKAQNRGRKPGQSKIPVKTACICSPV